MTHPASNNQSSNHNPHYLVHSKAVVSMVGSENCTCTIGDVLMKDYKSHKGIRSELLTKPCIDLDILEIARTNHRKKSMDMAVGVCNYDVVSRLYSGHRLLLVELKLDCDGRRFNITASELEGKVAHTRQVLVVNELVDSKNIFVFPEDKLAQALSNLSKWKRGSNSSAYAEYVFLDETGLNNLLSVETDFPIIYIYSKEKRILPDFFKLMKEFEADQDVEKLMDSLDRLVRSWQAIYDKLKQQYNIPEAKNVLESTIEGMSQVIEKMPPGDDRTYFQDELENMNRKLRGLESE